MMTQGRTFLFSLVLLFLLTSCGAGSTPVPTPTMTPPFGQRLEQTGNNELAMFETQQAEDLIWKRVMERMTATQAVLDATATQEQKAANAQNTAEAKVATQQVWKVTVQAAQAFDTATAQAQAAATQMAYVHATTTAEAQGTATQMAVVGLTATIAAHETSTAEYKTQQAPIIAAEQRALEAKTQSTELKLRQEKATEFFWAWFFPIAVVLALAAAVYVLWKKSKVGVIQDDRGNIRIVMINGQALNPDLMFRPVIQFRRDGAFAPILGTSDTDQRQVTHEAKVVSAIQALPPGYPKQGLNLVGGMATGQPAVNIQVVQPGQLGSLRKEFDNQIAGEVMDDD